MTVMDPTKQQPSTFRSKRFNWYIMRKDREDTNRVADESMQESPERKLSDNTYQSQYSLNEEQSEYRFCCGKVSAKYLANIFIIGLIQEISIGLIFATRWNLEWYKQVDLVVIAVLRVIQLGPAFAALIGTYNNNSRLLLPFVFSQITIGSYCDVQSYMLIVERCRQNQAGCFTLSNPLLCVLAPLFLYTVAVVLFVYVIYKTIKFVNVKRKNRAPKMTMDTQIESLM